MINLNKETEKKEKQSDNTIIWYLLISVAFVVSMIFCGWTGRKSGNEEVKELATKISNAYVSNYDIFWMGLRCSQYRKMR